MRKGISIIIIVLMFFYCYQDNNPISLQHLSSQKDNPKETGFLDQQLTTHLPLFIIYTNGNTIPQSSESSDEELNCDYAIIDYSNHLNCTTHPPTQTGKLAIHVRGNSSRHYKKKQYAIRTLDQNNQTIKTSMMGMPKESSWVLNGSYLDLSQMRNYMLYNISAQIMDYAPHSRFCEVFTTNADGELEYLGLYTMIEKPKVSKQRLDLSLYDPHYPQTSFVLQMNSKVEGITFQHLNQDAIRPNLMQLEYPKATEITKESIQYIKNEILIFEKTLYDAFYTNNWDLLNQQIDVESFIDYYLINEFFQNYDAGRRSTYLYKELGNKISIGPVWDFDGALNNYEGVNHPIDILAMKDTFYYFHLSQNETFMQQCIKRYLQLRKTTLSEASLIQTIDEISQYLASALLRNSDRWYEGNHQAVANDLLKMKQFVIERGKWLDENIQEYTTIIH